MQKTAIVIPCYNEEKRLDCESFLSFSLSNKNIYFIIVNDGSDDNTKNLINDLQQKSNNKITCIHLDQNSGKAEAVRQGFIEAFSMNFLNIGYWDADLATPLYEIINLCQCLEQTQIEMVFGARIRLLGREIERKTIRHYLGRMFASVVSCLLQINIYDSQCGAKLFKNTAELRAVFSQPFGVNWTFDVMLLARFIAVKKEAQITSIKNSAIEYPLQEWRDVPGSKIAPRDFFKVIRELISIVFFIYAPNWRNRVKKLLTL